MKLGIHVRKHSRSIWSAPEPLHKRGTFLKNHMQTWVSAISCGANDTFRFCRLCDSTRTIVASIHFAVTANPTRNGRPAILEASLEARRATCCGSAMS